MIQRLTGNAAGLRRRAAMLTIAALPALLLAACAREPLPLPEPVEIPFGQGRIWQVDREGLVPSYVFGTMHVDDRRILDLPEAVETAFAASEIAAFEVIDDPKTEEKDFDLSRIKLPDGKTLEGLIGSRSFGILRWHLRQNQLAPRNDVKPWVVWTYIGGENWGFGNRERLQPSSHGMVLDDWLEERARKGGKVVVGLETADEQFEIYDGLSLDQQVELLQLALDLYADRKPRAPRLQIYLDGDLAMIEALWREYLRRLAPETARALADRLIDDRNRIMVERMIPLMEKGSTFVAVGAAHMAGKAGVLRLLEQRGFTVTRVE